MISRLYYAVRSRWLLKRAKVIGGEQARFLNPIAPWISNSGRLVVGRGLRIDCFFAAARVHCDAGATLEIGENVYLNSGAHVFARRFIRIGDHSRIAEDSYISDTDFHEVAPGEPPRVAPITIGRNVWIGRKAIVLPGVTIGDHAVVAAGAIVTKDVPARSVVAGVPARVLRTFECADDWIRT
jgi:acetyltransferase-like isoleucine patch superfamily enzyme